jgi:hypothetical protein
MKIIKFALLTLLLTFTLSFASGANGPDVTLKSTVNQIDAGKLVKVSVGFSEPILSFGREQVSVDGASLESVRKIGPSSYLLFLRASDNVKELSVQVEADKVQNKNLVFNQNASNEVIIKVNPSQPTPAPQNDSTLDISGFLDAVKASAQQQSAQAQGLQVQVRGLRRVHGEPRLGHHH